MKNRKASLLILFISLFFAGVIVVTSYFMEFTQFSEHKETVTFVLIALWYIPFLYLSNNLAKNEK
ncbi:MAG: hypothetical protein JEY94_17405 [Melioribacteraceae bacterium]|nr:hypothetical protein [Melioribacteraceae bacterium]